MPTEHWRGALRSLAEAGDPGARKLLETRETRKSPTTIANPVCVGNTISLDYMPLKINIPSFLTTLQSCDVR